VEKEYSKRGIGVKIVEYDEADPLKVMAITQLALDFSLTPERAQRIRQTDPRPFPCLSVVAVEDDLAVGHAGIFRLPMISTEGREDVGGVWAVATHPQYKERGVASLLLEEAHARMRAAGLRFSTLGTDQSRLAHRLYRQLGYEETNVWASALARWDTAHQPTRLRAHPLDEGGYDLVERIFTDIAGGYLGFAWRHTPFAALRLINRADIWILLENTHPIGYALVHADESLLSISNLTLRAGIDANEAVAAVAAGLKSAFVQVKLSRPVEIASLRRSGFHVAQPTWSGFMVKPLRSEVTYEDARRLYGIGTDRFLISWLDVT
jgi:GNAT superfamily N-acetyltransferase